MAVARIRRVRSLYQTDTTYTIHRSRYILRRRIFVLSVPRRRVILSHGYLQCRTGGKVRRIENMKGLEELGTSSNSCICCKPERLLMVSYC